MASADEQQKNRNMLELRGLLHTCCNLAQKACSVIRKVDSMRRQNGGSTLPTDVVFADKDASDPRTALTLADISAHAVILEGLRAQYGSTELAIVSEEDESTAGETFNNLVTPDDLNDSVEMSEDITGIPYAIPDELEYLVPSEIVVFVDPLDGTREFVQGRTQAVQVLIGVAYRGRPIVGVIGLPFVQDDRAHLLYGVSGSPSGIGTTVGNPALSTNENDEDTKCLDKKVRLAISADLGANTSVAAVPEVMKDMFGIEAVPVGGCGYKVLQLLTGEADVAVFNLKSSRWDTCALQSVLEASGGKLSNLFGWPIEHRELKSSSGNGSNCYLNRFGVLATASSFRRFCKNPEEAHVALCQRLAQHQKVQELLYDEYFVKTTSMCERSMAAPQAFDVCRDINGDPFKVCDMCDMMQLSVCWEQHPDATMSCNASEAVKYKQSHAGRIRVSLTYDKAGKKDHPRQDECSTNQIFDASKSAFFKRVVLRELPHAMWKFQNRAERYKLARDVKGNLAEAAILSSPLARSFNHKYYRDEVSGKFKLPMCYDARSRVHEDNPIDSRFTLLLEDFCPNDGWSQYPLLDETHMKASFAAAAAWHAHFWLAHDAVTSDSNREHSEQLKILCEQVWPAAGYWDLDKQPSDHLEKLTANWAHLLQQLRNETEDFRDPGWDTVGERLAARAKSINEYLHKSSEDPSVSSSQTILHGDLKAANLFFKCNEAAFSNASGGPCCSTSDPLHRPNTDNLTDSENNRIDVKCGLIDFQWSGFGLVATDLAYCVAAAMDPRSLHADPDENGELTETHLLRFYHEELTCNLSNGGIKASDIPTWSSFYSDYMKAFLDICRVTICAWWIGGNTVKVLKERQTQNSMLYNAGNKNFDLARWMLKRLKRHLDAMDELE